VLPKITEGEDQEGYSVSNGKEEEAKEDESDKEDMDKESYKEDSDISEHLD